MPAAEEKRTKPREVCLPVSSCRCQAALALGANVRYVLRGQCLDRGVGEGAGAVEDRAEGVLLGDRANASCRASLSATSQAGICTSAPAPRALRAALCALGLGARAAEQEQPAGAVVLCEVLGEERAEARWRR